MKVVDVIHVTGRGWVVVCDEDDELICGDVVGVKGKDNKFTIDGIEKATNLSQVGFVLSPNNEVIDNIAIGDSLYVQQLCGKCKTVKENIKTTLQKPIFYHSSGEIGEAKFIIGSNMVFFERKGVCYVMVGRLGASPLLPIKEKFDELERLVVK